jgi:hypothetical protein
MAETLGAFMFTQFLQTVLKIMFKKKQRGWMLLNPVHIAYRDISDWKPIVSVYKIAIPTSL